MELLLVAMTLGNYRPPDTSLARELYNMEVVHQRLRAVRTGGPELKAASEALSTAFRHEGLMHKLLPDPTAEAPVVAFLLNARVGRCYFTENLRLKLPAAASLLEALRLAHGTALPAEEAR
jgi:hypothetical protein